MGCHRTDGSPHPNIHDDRKKTLEWHHFIIKIARTQALKGVAINWLPGYKVDTNSFLSKSQSKPRG